jgi:Emfourin
VKVAIKQSGGYAGEVKDLLQLDTAQIEPSVSQQVERIIRDAKFFDLPNVVQGDVGADFLRYEITVTDGRQHTVSFQDDGGPKTAAMKKLLESLLKLRG